ncbi:MAG: PVC-type heme-binding CxxCH protein, partial [Planctomycetaceae bacterium]
VAITFDEKGRMWVVEMIDYPRGPKEGEAPRSRIRILSDADGDGRFEVSRLFADQLLFATGIQLWRGGAIVTLAGRVAWFKDTDGDDRADVEETWFTGFAEQNSQLRANHPTFGLDNRVSIANGLRGGDVIAVKSDWKSDAKPLSISGRDFRFDPNSGRYEAMSGIGQFGLTFDDFGNRFVCSNRNPCQHVVLEDEHLRRNPDLAAGAVMHDVSPAAELSRVYSLSRAWTTSTLHAGQFTAACGVTIYRGDMLPTAYRGNSFTCEPTGSLVHRDVLKPDGATFRAEQSSKKSEFISSPDDWFRPVNLANGPDGALYVVDMYRAVIEHPDWVPDELKNRPDERFGEDRGRIYRIVPSNSGKRSVTKPSHATAHTSELVQLLEHPNSWHRETAARLLYEQQDESAGAALKKLLRESRSPLGRIHALWALEGFGQLDSDLLVELLARETDSRVAEQGLRLSERRIRADAKLQNAVLNFDRNRGDARLDFQLALTLGEVAAERDAVAALAMLGLDRSEDVWTRKAIASSAAGKASLLFERLVNGLTVRQNWDQPGVASLMEEVATLVGTATENKNSVKALDDIGFISLYYGVKSRPVASVLFRSLIGLGNGLARQGVSLADQLPKQSEPSRALLDTILTRAADVAASTKDDAGFRKEAIAVLRFVPSSKSKNALRELATSEPDQSVRLAAIDVLSTAADPEIGKSLVAEFAAQTPTVKRAILEALLQTEPQTLVLLGEVQAGRIRASEIDPVRWSQLAKHRNGEISVQAKSLYDASLPADRQKVLAEYQKALSLKSDTKRGRDVFAKNCAGCHRIGEIGVNVAPDIADSRTQQPSQLLTSILDPNRAVDNNYFSYTVVMLDGKVHSGVIASETSASITLRQQENRTLELLRRDIEEVRSNGVSLMPVGLEKNVTVEQMADLIDFIKNWRYLDGSVPAVLGK